MAISVDTSEEPAYLSDGSYTADNDRRWFRDIMRDGIINSGDFLVSAGTLFNLSIASGKAFVEGLNVNDQGMYRVREPNTNTNTITIPTADLTKPRIDQIVLLIMDASNDTSGARKGQLKLIQGTATTGATLSNRTGAADLTTLTENTKSVLLLADVLVPAGVTTTAACIVRDRRRITWPRNVPYVSKVSGPISNLFIIGNSTTEDDLVPSQTIPGYFLRSSVVDIIRCTMSGTLENSSGTGRTFTFKLYAARGNQVFTLVWGDTSISVPSSTDLRPFKFKINLNSTFSSSNAFIEISIGNNGTVAGGYGDIGSTALLDGSGLSNQVSPAVTDTNLDLKWKLTVQISGSATPSTQIIFPYILTEIL